MSKPTADWDRVGDRFYRKTQLYTDVFDPDLELEHYLIVGAPYSGAVAFHRDEKKLHTYRASQAAKSSIDIYSCAGKLIRRINWEKGVIKGLGWSEDEKLLVVTEDGTVRCYYDLHGDFVPFNLGHGADDHGVIACRFWSSGFVALLGNNHLIAVSQYDEPRPHLLATPPEGDIASWTLIPPNAALSRSVEVLLAIGPTIYVVDASEAEDRGLDGGPFKHMSVSPNGKFVALYTENGKVWVVSSDFQNRLSEYDTRATTVPKDMQWCGNNAVALAWEDEVHVVGPNGASSKHFYDGWVHLIADYDGIRILTNEVCEFLQKVPDVTEDVFRLGSTSPAAVLLDAIEQLEKKSPKADDNIQLIRPTLDEAVDTCVRAAGHEFSVHWQKQLLKAASFGKSVLDLYNSDEFVEMTETLRVLHAVRFYSVGLPLSYEQYIRLTPEKLISRLTNRHEYLLALRISEYLHLPTADIYVHWASQKVRVSTADEDAICQLIVQKLSTQSGVSFEHIARAAYDEGRARLATSLLNHEPRAGKQVPLLISMNEAPLALDKAIASGDTDLVYHVLLHLKKTLPLATFFRTINARPVATALVQASAQDTDRGLLKDLYYQDDRRLDGANLLFGEALAHQTDAAARNERLRLATKLIADSRELAFESKAIDEAQRLLKLQEALEKDVNAAAGSSASSATPTAGSAPSTATLETFVGLSVNHTLHKLVRLGMAKRAQRLVTDFKVPEKTWWWVRLRALVARRDWAALEEIGRVKKSPIGWEPFFNAILSAGNSRLAGDFVPKCTSATPADRVDMWVKCGLVVKAAEEAARAKMLPRLEELRAGATGNAAVEVERIVRGLERGRK